jgi:hypothetical protein
MVMKEQLETTMDTPATVKEQIPFWNHQNPLFCQESVCVYITKMTVTYGMEQKYSVDKKLWENKVHEK